MSSSMSERILTYANYHTLSIPSIFDGNFMSISVESLTFPKPTNTIHDDNRKIELDGASINLDIGKYNITELCAELQTKLGTDYTVSYSETDDAVSIENTGVSDSTLVLYRLQHMLGFESNTLTLESGSTLQATQGPDLFGPRQLEMYIVESLNNSTVSSVSSDKLTVADPSHFRSSGSLFKSGIVYKYSKLMSDELQLSTSNHSISASDEVYDVHLIKPSSGGILALKERLLFSLLSGTEWKIMKTENRSYWVLIGFSEKGSEYPVLKLPVSKRGACVHLNYNFL